ncbi:hypothetical protein NQ314_003632 [Rhamnusium bicolor]|uniref:RNA-binding S4 domain-containing protein n=1 Tax=Rhamnusium bicolor TaxID=1586634 RepID=A0AAV8ZNN5_9CUCU|nr:hypothetical protein NQ314_003632 [Rhamnusium bicolor]
MSYNLLRYEEFVPKKAVEKLVHHSKTNNFSTICSKLYVIQPAKNNFQHNLQIYRFKSKRSKNKRTQEYTSDSEKEEPDKDFLDNVQDKHTKTLKVDITSMRLDAILKAGLGLSRNKIELTFYESKIRLNGEKVLKKSAHVQEGDEIDVIKGVNMNNPEFLTVARVEVLSAIGQEESISVKLRRCKSLTVENYKDKNRWEP